ncbi:MAG: FAD-binding oxidoreductase [Vicinamibacteria bacterium]|nr:FAD-binding oxidoreductase [Vicinamibacteria bacterium]
MPDYQEKAGVVIVGAGFAGAATAFALSRRGVSDIVILEKEHRIGAHSSGLNAGLGRQVVASPELLPLVVEGMRFLHTPPEGFPSSAYLRATGSLILAEEPQASKYREALASLRAHGLSAEWISHAEVERLVPPTRGGAFDGGILCRQDGVIDVDALLGAYLHAAADAGTRLILGRPVTGVGVAERAVTHVDTPQGRIMTSIVINAAGAWAGKIAALAGAGMIPLRSFRRHIAVSEPFDMANQIWPFVWDESHGLYFRQEPPGLLLSPCDEAEQSPEPLHADPGVLDLLADKIRRFMPALGDLAIARSWAGLYTLTPDGNFVIGPDPRIRGFVWCAGLGLHGVTASAAVGRLAAQAALGREIPPVHAPSRLESPGSTDALTIAVS